MKHTKICITAGLLFLTIAARAGIVAVDPAIPAYRPVSPALTGKLAIADCSENLKRFMVVLHAAFHGIYPQVNCSFEHTSSERAFGELGEGSVQVVSSGILPADKGIGPYGGPAATAYRSRTVSAGSWPKGYAPFGVPVSKCGYDPAKGIPFAIVLCVHPDNPVTELTVPQIDAIFTSTRHCGLSADLISWEQVGWPVKPGEEAHKIHLYGRDYQSVKYWAFKQILGGGEYKENLAMLRGGDEQVPVVVATDGAGIGFLELTRKSPVGAKYLAVADRAGLPAASPTLENVRANRYPFFQTGRFYVKREPLGAGNIDTVSSIDPIAKEFVRYMLSQEGQTLAAAHGILPLNADEVQASLAMLE